MAEKLPRPSQKPEDGDKQLQELMAKAGEVRRMLAGLSTEQDQRGRRPRNQNEISTLTMLRKLWKIVSPDCRAALLGEFLFNPNQLKERYEEEMRFRHNVENLWEE